MRKGDADTSPPFSHRHGYGCRCEARSGTGRYRPTLLSSILLRPCITAILAFSIA